MKAVGALIALVLLAGCGSQEISDTSAAKLSARVDEIREAIAGDDPTRAASRLDLLQDAVARMLADGEISGDKAREILAAAAQVDDLIVIPEPEPEPAPTPTQTYDEDSEPKEESTKEPKGDEDHGKKKGHDD